jgi:cytochrome c oxidase cbb3-type subunit 3
VQEGAAVFATTCAACHAPTGGGNIGPNLTDEYWLHGGAPEEIYKSIRDGFPTKGMPAWGAQLGERRVRAVTAYVLSIRNTHAPGGKPPQGDEYATR